MTATHRVTDLWSGQWGIGVIDVEATHTCDEQCEADACPDTKWECMPEGCTQVVEIAGREYPRGVFMSWDRAVDRWGPQLVERVRGLIHDRFGGCAAY